MFDPRDLATGPRTRKPAARPRRDHAKERESRQRDGHRREYDPRTKRQNFQDRIDRAVADIGVYRSVATRDLAEAHFEGHPFAARRAVDRMVRARHVREHTAHGPQGGAYKVLTLTGRGVERAERVAREQGLDPEQKAWSGLVKPGELQHDVAVFRAARIEQARLPGAQQIPHDPGPGNKTPTCLKSCGPPPGSAPATIRANGRLLPGRS